MQHEQSDTEPAGLIDWRIERVARTGSTNADVAARALAGEPEGLVLVADHQQGGRGRLARTWVTPAGTSVTASVLLRPDGVPTGMFGWLPLLAGLAVADAVRSVCAVPVSLKWPNDVLLRPQVGGQELKVCGVLAEVSGTAVVIGAGINVTQDAAQLPVPTATSLHLAGAVEVTRDDVLHAYLAALAVRYRAFVTAGGDPVTSGIGEAYRAVCATPGREIEVHLPGDRVERGLATGIDREGRLLVRLGAREQPFAAGDVIHVRRAADSA